MSADRPANHGQSSHGLRGDYSRMRPGLHRRAGPRRLHRGASTTAGGGSTAGRSSSSRAAPATSTSRALRSLDYEGGIPRFETVNRQLGAATGWQLVAVPGLVPGPRLLRAPREPPLPRHPLDPRGARVRLHRRARRLPRLLRPRADALRPRLRRLHGGLRQGRPQGRGPRRAAVAGAALLVHGRVRPHPHPAGPAQLRRRHPLLARRDRPRASTARRPAGWPSTCCASCAAATASTPTRRRTS